MLVLARKTNESLVIDGRIVVRVMRVEGDTVKIGIDAPKEVPVFRSEIYEEIEKSNREAVTLKGSKVDGLLAKGLKKKPARSTKPKQKTTPGKLS